MGKLSKAEAMLFREHLGRLLDPSEESFLFVHSSGVCAMNIYNSEDAQNLTKCAAAAVASVGLSGGHPMGDVISLVLDSAKHGVAIARVFPVSKGNEHRAWPVTPVEPKTGQGSLFNDK